MGMTIDEAYKILFNGLANAPSEQAWCEAFKLSLETMRKYQKIQETMNRWYEDKTWEFDTSYLYEIGEILEDGNDD